LPCRILLRVIESGIIPKIELAVAGLAALTAAGVRRQRAYVNRTE
jgi:hypothetical protein